MQYIITIVMTLLIIGCTTTQQPMKKEVKEEKAKDILMALPTSSGFTEYNQFENNLSSHTYDIEGRYKLYRGLYMNGKAHQGEITHAYMVVEKLGDNDFGYFFADKLKGSETMSTFGVFHYDEKEKKFHQKFIDGDSYVVRKGGIDIKSDGMRLQLSIRQTAGQKVIIWEKLKEDAIGVIDDEIDGAIKDAEDSYHQVYRAKREEVVDGGFFGRIMNIIK